MHFCHENPRFSERYKVWYDAHTPKGKQREREREREIALSRIQLHYKIIHKKFSFSCDNNRHKVNIGNCLPVNHYDVITFHWKSSVTRGGIIQVTGGSSADPLQSAAGLKYSAVGL